MTEIRETKMYSVPELAKILNFERHTIYRLIESGRLKGVQTMNRGHYRVIGKFLIEFIEKGKNAS